MNESSYPLLQSYQIIFDYYVSIYLFSMTGGSCGMQCRLLHLVHAMKAPPGPYPCPFRTAAIKSLNILFSL
jgi:hypothetical protein